MENSVESQKLCKNCKWYFNPCEKPTGVCHHPKVGLHFQAIDYMLEQNNLDIAFVAHQPTNQYIESGQNFGCVHWEEKP